MKRLFTRRVPAMLLALLLTLSILPAAAFASETTTLTEIGNVTVAVSKTDGSATFTLPALESGKAYVYALSDTAPTDLSTTAQGTTLALADAKSVTDSTCSIAYSELDGKCVVFYLCDTPSTSDYTVYGYKIYASPVVCKVTYELNGGKVGESTAAQTEYYAAGATLSIGFSTPAKENATFNAWYDAADGGNAVTAASSSSSSATVYAQYTANPTASATVSAATGLTAGTDSALVSGTATGGTLYYQVTDENGTVTDSAWTTTAPTAADKTAKTYWVYYTVDNIQSGYTAPDYSNGYPHVEVTLTAATTAKTAVTPAVPIANKGLVANGSAQQLAAAQTQPEGVTMSYSLDNTTWETDISKLTGTAAQDYTVYWKAAVTDVTKYTLSESSGSITVTISAASKTDPTYTAPAAKALTYNSTAQALVSAGSVTTGGTMQYSLDNQTWVTDVSKITATNAGDYTVYYKVPATDTTNEKTGTVKVTIAKAAITVKAKDASKIYGAADPTLSYDVTAGDRKALSGSLARVSGENVGTYAIQQGALATDSNHTISFTGATLTISMAGNEWTVKPNIAGWTYGTPNSPSGSAKYGTITFTYSDKSDGAYTTTKPTAVGTYYMKASVAATSNYTGLTTDPQTFVIAAKSIKDSSVTITVDPSKATYTGKTITPTVTIKDGSTTLTAGTDYELSGGTSGKKTGTYTITVKGKGNYSGETTVKWKIVSATDSTSPKTGDTQNPTVWFVALTAAGVALAAIAAVGILRKKRTEE